MDEPKTDSQKLICAAPEDVTVADVKVLKGMVKSGQTMVTLTSIRLEWMRARLDSQAANLEVYLRPFKDGRVDQVLEILKEEFESAKKNREATDLFLLTVEARYKIDAVSYQDVLNTMANHAAAGAKLASAKTELGQFPKKVQDMKDRADIAKSRLEIEKGIISKRIASLNIVAPCDGLFVASVGAGGFVEEGDEVGVIYL